VGYALRANLSQLAPVTGRPAQELKLSGGMSRSATLTRIIADIVGMPVLVASEPESAGLGCAILIAADCGSGDLASAARLMARYARIDPDPEQHERYAAPYAR